MKTYWGVEVKLHPFLTSALDEGAKEITENKGKVVSVLKTKKQELKEICRTSQSEILHNKCASPNFVRVVKQKE
jgi:hypothetical protein